MSLSRQQKDADFSKLNFRIANFMSFKSPNEMLERLDSGSYFAFMVVRHPLERLLSAYRDRILNGCSGQAKETIPRIFGMFKMKHA